MAGYDIADVGDLDAEGPGGMVRKVRRAVGAKAFGCNYFIFPPNQEEVYFVVKGSGTMRIDGKEVELRPGRFVRVDPGATRVLVSGADGLESVTFGAPLDGQYEPPSWG